MGWLGEGGWLGRRGFCGGGRGGEGRGLVFRIEVVAGLGARREELGGSEGGKVEEKEVGERKEVELELEFPSEDGLSSCSSGNALKPEVQHVRKPTRSPPAPSTLHLPHSHSQDEE